MKNKIFFYLFLFLSFLCLLFTWAFYEEKNLINIAIETEIENNNDILLKIDDKYTNFKCIKNSLVQTIYKKINSLELLIDKNFNNEIKSIAIFNDTKMYHYQNFSEFEKSQEKLCTNDSCKIYNKYKIKDEAIISHENKLYSFLHSLTKFDVIFYPFFILMFLTIFYGYKLKLNKFILPICIFVLAIILRLNDIDTFEPWGDECHSINISRKNLPFLILFNDPGNPPFYYFTLKILRYFSDSVIDFRLLSIAFSIFGGVFLYLFLYKNYSNKMATIASFLYAINLPLIYYSQEIRSYSLQVLLAILILICVYEILKKENNKKYWIFYGILTIIAVNTHYYQVIFAFTNFLYLGFEFIRNKRKSDLIWLFGVNFVALLSFLPYYLITAHNKALLDESFNSFRPAITFKLVQKNILYIFGGLPPLILSIIFLFKKLESDKEKRKICNYCFWIIFSVNAIGIILSLIIRPCYVYNYTLFLIPFALIILTNIFSYNYKHKYVMILLSIICVFSMQNFPQYSLADLKYTTLNNQNIFEMVQKDLQYRYSGFNSMLIANKDNKYNFTKKRISNRIIYTLYVEQSKNGNEYKNYACYFNSGRNFCLLKIE